MLGILQRCVFRGWYLGYLCYGGLSLSLSLCLSLCNAHFITHSVFQFGASSLTRHMNVYEVIIYMQKTGVEFTFLLYWDQIA
jgi:hypothetical protein